MNARFAFERSDLSLGLVDAAFDGDGVADAEIRFTGITGITGKQIPVKTELDLMSARLEYTWDVGSIGAADWALDWALDWGLGVGVAYVDLELDMKPGAGFGDRPGDRFEGSLPLVALRFALERGRWATPRQAATTSASSMRGWGRASGVSDSHH
ncbi:MAG: hypothetical protein GY711_06035 [bacterium]|nr:hypothetical protein [bacterium]